MYYYLQDSVCITCVDLIPFLALQQVDLPLVVILSVCESITKDLHRGGLKTYIPYQRPLTYKKC